MRIRIHSPGWVATARSGDERELMSNQGEAGDFYFCVGVTYLFGGGGLIHLLVVRLNNRLLGRSDISCFIDGCRSCVGCDSNTRPVPDNSAEGLQCLEPGSRRWSTCRLGLFTGTGTVNLGNRTLCRILRSYLYLAYLHVKSSRGGGGDIENKIGLKNGWETYELEIKVDKMALKCWALCFS